MKITPATLRTAHRKGAAGFSIVEAMVAVAIIALSLGAMMTLNGQQLRLVKISRDTNAATLYQQERVEQLRQVRWPDLTSGTYISTTYMGARPKSEAALDRVAESITISPYPTAARGGTALRVSQAVKQQSVVDSSLTGFGLTNERLVKVVMTLSWKGADGRARQRETSTLISNSGITRSNLPALGPVSGGPWEPYSTPTAATPVATPVSATPIGATPDPSTPTNNGNGKGKGNGKGNTGNGNGKG